MPASFAAFRDKIERRAQWPAWPTEAVATKGFLDRFDVSAELQCDAAAYCSIARGRHRGGFTRSSICKLRSKWDGRRHGRLGLSESARYARDADFRFQEITITKREQLRDIRDRRSQ
jgi:hypothetical protein